MTALEEIKKALEGDMNTGLTAIDRLRFIVGGVPDFDPTTVEDADWIIAALESLQRDNEELRKKADARENELVAMLNSADESRVAQIRRAESAEAEVKRLKTDRLYIIGFNEGWEAAVGEPPENASALASTGGEHHAE